MSLQVVVTRIRAGEAVTGKGDGLAGAHILIRKGGGAGSYCYIIASHLAIDDSSASGCGSGAAVILLVRGGDTGDGHFPLRHGDGRAGRAIVGIAGVGDRQSRAGGRSLQHLYGGSCGIPAGNDLQDGIIGAGPFPSAAIGSGLGGSHGEVRIAIGLAGGRGGDAYTCILLVYHSYMNGKFRRCSEIVRTIGVHLDFEGGSSGYRGGSLQFITGKRDTGRCAAQRVGQLCVAVGVGKGGPVGNIDFHSIIHKLARGRGSNDRRGLIDGEEDRGGIQLQIKVITSLQCADPDDISTDFRTGVRQRAGLGGIELALEGRVTVDAGGVGQGGVSRAVGLGQAGGGRDGHILGNQRPILLRGTLVVARTRDLQSGIPYIGNRVITADFGVVNAFG